MLCQEEGTGDGPFSAWYSNRQIKVLGNLSGDRANGSWTYWYSTGEKRAEGVCLDGKTTPEWKTYPPPAATKKNVASSEEQIEYCQLGHDYPPLYYNISTDDDVLLNPTRLLITKENDWLNFRVEPLLVQQFSGGVSTSVGLYYAPIWKRFKRFVFGTRIGAFQLFDLRAKDRFWIAEIAGSAGIQIVKPIRVEIGCGVQYWSARVNTGATLFANVAWMNPFKWKNIKSIYVGTGTFLNGSSPALESRVGLEWGF